MALLVDHIIRPILTEKTLTQARNGRYTFEVTIDTNKDQIREALKESFGVKVKSVKTAVMKNEKRIIAKSRRQVPGSIWKKAVVELTSGKLDMFEISGGGNDKES